MADMIRARDKYRKSDLAGETNSAERAFKAAMHSALWGRTGRIADALGLGQRTVETWQNPNDPQHGPLHQLYVVMREALDAGADESDALAPLRLLNRMFERDPATESLLRAAAEAARETGEAVEAAVKAGEDKHVDPVELDRIEREVDEGIAKLLNVKRAARALAGAKPALRSV